jgi:beta-lactamase class A
MIVPRLLLAAVAGTAAMAGLVGSVAPVRMEVEPELSTMEQPAPTRWIGEPLASARSGIQQQIQDKAVRQQREAALTAKLNGKDIGVAVLDRHTGHTYTYNGTKQFRTASIVKVDILATLLLQANRAGRSLNTSERQLASAMIKYSDNDAASTLWRRIGGISNSMSTFGLTSTKQGSDGDWGETTTTAEDQLRLLQRLADNAIPGSDYILNLMSGVASDQDWGVSAAAKQGEKTALKNGWYPLSGGWIINSLGRITDTDSDLLIVVLSRGHSSYASGIRAVEQVAALVRDTIGG